MLLHVEHHVGRYFFACRNRMRGWEKNPWKVSSAGNVPPGLLNPTHPARLSLFTSVFSRMTFCQFVRRAPQASRICGRKGCRWKIRESCAPSPGQLASGRQLLLDKCTRRGRFVRKAEQGASAIAPSGFPFARSPEGLPSLQIENQAGKSSPKSRLPEENFPK